MACGQDGFRYRAFISYSHADKATAVWLHRALESYRLPRPLVGSQTALGPVPGRLGPIFRDREELAAVGDLSAELTAALADSRFLIVIASPNAVQSHWVNEEIRQFKLVHAASGGATRVLALIPPDAGSAPGGAAFFPPALRHKLGPGGELLPDLAEPIAADLRPGADGRRMVLLKLVAALTGVRLDDLTQRDQARRQRRLLVFAGAALLLAGVMAVLAVLAVRGQAEAERQRAQSDGLVEFMLTDLRRKLEPVGRLDVLDAVGQKALAYYSAQKLATLNADALGRRARALHLVGEVRDLRGDSAGALRAFTEAAGSTAELLARAPDDPDQMFDHAQSVYWVGYVAWQRQEFAKAEARFRDYDRLAAALVASDPGNPRWQQEQSYAHSNLGTLHLETGRYPEAVERFRRALQIEQRLAAGRPDDAEQQWQLAQSHAWLAKALTATSALSAAMRQSERELAIYDAMLARDGGDAKARAGRAVTLSYIAHNLMLQGQYGQASSLYDRAHREITALTRTDPANQFWQESALLIDVSRIHTMMMNRQWQAAARAHRPALAKARAMLRLDPSMAIWRRDGLVPLRWMEIALRFADRDRATARRLMADFHRDFASQRRRGENGGEWAMVLAMEGLAAQADGNAAAAERLLASAMQALGPSPTGWNAAMKQYLARGTPASAPAGMAQATPGPSEIGYDPAIIIEVAGQR